MINRIDKLFGRAIVAPESLNVGEREVDVVFASETPVFRLGWSEDYNEICFNSNMVRLKAIKFAENNC